MIVEKRYYFHMFDENLCVFLRAAFHPTKITIKASQTAKSRTLFYLLCFGLLLACGEHHDFRNALWSVNHRANPCRWPRRVWTDKEPDGKGRHMLDFLNKGESIVALVELQKTPIRKIPHREDS